MSFVVLFVFFGVASLSRFDSNLIAHEKQEQVEQEQREKQEQVEKEQRAAVRQRENERTNKAHRAYIEQLKADGRYDLWQFIQTGEVPERFWPTEQK